MHHIAEENAAGSAVDALPSEAGYLAFDKPFTVSCTGHPVTLYARNSKEAASVSMLVERNSGLVLPAGLMPPTHVRLALLPGTVFCKALNQFALVIILPEKCSFSNA